MTSENEITISLKEVLALTDKQKQCLSYLRDGNNTEILYGGGAGGGKSFLGCVWLIINCLKYPGTRWLMGRAKLKTLTETTLNTFFQVVKVFNLQAEIDYKYNGQRSTILFYNGSEILLKDLFAYPSDPNFDSLGSLEITGAFVDECNQIVAKAWEILKSRIRYRLDEYGLIPKILGSCNPSKNWVYTRFYKPSKDGTLPANYKFIQALVTDNRHISKHYIDNLLSITDNNAKQRLYYGNWEYDDDPSVLMDFTSITNLFSNSFVEKGNPVITADIARFGADKTVIGVWSGYRLEYIETINKNSVTEAANAIEKLRLHYSVPLSSVLVDEDGVGGGVKDILNCSGFVNNATPIVSDSGKENFSNLKSQCSYKLAERVNRSEVYINCSDVNIKELIVEELAQIKQRKVDTDDKLAVTRKEDVKEALGRSPDYADMIMMRVWFDLKKDFKFW